ncbi:MAG: hypothetical protein IPP27_10670 [Bacteroidetes bacterium]|nr:hypothetical protein [Bacteroidota bacterium]
MKLRLKGNTIRFRLSKTDVSIFSENRYIHETTDFGNKVFTYGLKMSENTDRISAEFLNDAMIINIPISVSQQWTTSNQVGLSEEMPLSEGKKLYILIEKDFQCLDETIEDQSDNYENPLASKLK